MKIIRVRRYVGTEDLIIAVNVLIKINEGSFVIN